MSNNSKESILIKCVIFQLILYLRHKKFDYNTYLTKLKVAKIIFDVTKKLNLPITNSWYLRGCYIYPADDNSFLFDPHNWDSINTKEIDSLQKDNQELFHDVRTEIYKFLDDTEILTTRTNDFLITLYQQFAPERYRDIYLTNNLFLNLLQNSLLEIIDNNKREHVQVLFKELNINISDRFSPIISNLQLSLSNKEEFNECQEITSVFLCLIEEILIKLNSTLIKSERISQNIESFIKEIGKIYYDNIWKMIALTISQHTLEGPRAEIIRENQKREYSILLNKVNDIIKDIQYKAEALNLIPTHQEYEQFFLSKYKIDKNTRNKLSEIL